MSAFHIASIRLISIDELFKTKKSDEMNRFHRFRKTFPRFILSPSDSFPLMNYSKQKNDEIGRFHRSRMTFPAFQLASKLDWSQ